MAGSKSSRWRVYSQSYASAVRAMSPLVLGAGVLVEALTDIVALPGVGKGAAEALRVITEEKVSPVREASGRFRRAARSDRGAATT